MLKLPGFRFYLPPDAASRLHGLERRVPGTLVTAKLRNRSYPMRVKKLEPGYEDRVEFYQVNAPANCAYLVEGALGGLIAETEAANGADALLPWPEAGPATAELIAAGKAAVAALVARGRIGNWRRDESLGPPTPYQFSGAGFAETRGSMLVVAPTGSGKTRLALMATECRLAATGAAGAGACLIVCPAKARKVWRDQIPKYTGTLPFRLLPKSERRARDGDLDGYIRAARSSGRRPYIIVGMESLPDLLGDVLAMSPVALLVDEVHEVVDHRRVKATAEADGSIGFEPMRTAASNREGSGFDRRTRSSALTEVSRLDSLAFACGLTATLLFAGKIRNVYVPLDLVWPGGFGWSYWDFAARYCDAHEGEFGGMVDTGRSNVEELRARCTFLMQQVEREEVVEYMPPVRQEVVWLDGADLNRADAYAREIARIDKTAATAVDDRDAARVAAIEVRLAHAASMKKSWAWSEMEPALRGGGKVVVFTARRLEVERLTAYLRGRISAAKIPARLEWAHGGVSEARRDELLEWFKAAEGPCVLVATGQSLGTSTDDLKTADLALIVMLPWEPGALEQWAGRFGRLGGRPTIVKIGVAAGTYDERVLSLLRGGFETAQGFLGSSSELAGKLLDHGDRDKMLDSFLAALQPTTEGTWTDETE